MINNLPEELKEAEEFLKEFEKSEDYSLRKCRCFEDAMIAFEKHLSNNPNSVHREWIEQRKHIYTRVFVKQLERIPQEEGLKYLFE